MFREFVQLQVWTNQDGDIEISQGEGAPIVVPPHQAQLLADWLVDATIEIASESQPEARNDGEA